MATIRNTKTGETVTTPWTNAEAAARFAELYANRDSFVWYWLHKLALDATPASGSQSSGTPQDRSIQFLGDQFLLAVGYGLKRPMIRVHYRDQRFKFYLSKAGTICLKSGKLETACSCGTVGDHDDDPVRCRGERTNTHDPVGDEEYVGCLLRGSFLQARVSPQPDNGDYYRTRRGRRYDRRPNYNRDDERNRPLRPLTATEQEFLAELAKDPTGFLASCSKDMGRCCYCNNPLEDARSKAVGYGQTCAKHWGLPWGETKSSEKAPSFSQDWNLEAHGLCIAIRDNPRDEVTWAVFGDWLEEHGLPRPKVPAAGITLPRNDEPARPAAKPAQPAEAEAVAGHDDRASRLAASVAAAEAAQGRPLTENQRRAVDKYGEKAACLLKPNVAKPAAAAAAAAVKAKMEAAELGTVTVHSSALRWDKATQTFTGEMSNMDWPAETWPDRIILTSERTGTAKTFGSPTIRSDDDDVTWVDWKSDSLTIRLFND